MTTGRAWCTEPGDRREQLAWLFALGLALALRFYDLGGRPLDPAEATLALEAYRSTGSGRGWGASESTHPALASALSTIFYLFGSSDASARLVSALAGVATVAGIWWARPSLGRPAALAAAALVAVSPSHVELSRSATPAALLGLSLVAVLLIAQSLVTRFDARVRPLMVGGSALAIGLGTDSTLALHLLALIGAVIFAFDLSIVRERLAVVRRWSWQPLIGAFVLTAAVVDTRLGTNLGGIQAGLIDNLWTWATEVLVAGRLPLLPVVYLLGSEPLLIVMAVIGAFGAARGSAFVRFAAAWLLLVFGLTVVWGRVDGRMLAPLIIAAAVVGGPAVARLATHSCWWDRRAYVVAAAAAVPLIAAFIASLPALRSSTAPSAAVITAGVAGLGGALIGAYALTGWRTARSGLLVMATAMVGLTTIASLSRLGESDMSDHGRLTPGTVVTPELRRVQSQLAIWEWDQDGRRIVVDERLQPVLGWTLRGNRAARFAAPEEVQTGPAVKLATSRAEALPERAERVTVAYRALPPVELEPTRVAEWLIWRRSLPRMEAYDILLLR